MNTIGMPEGTVGKGKNLRQDLGIQSPAECCQVCSKPDRIRGARLRSCTVDTTPDIVPLVIMLCHLGSRTCSVLHWVHDERGGSEYNDGWHVLNQERRSDKRNLYEFRRAFGAPLIYQVVRP